jgi:hypothetical protein
MDAEPSQVFFDPLIIFLPAPLCIEVFMPQQHHTAVTVRLFARHPRGQRMAEVKMPGRTRRKAGDRHGDGLHATGFTAQEHCACAVFCNGA